MNQLKLKNEFVKLDSSKRLYQLECPVIGLTGGIATGKTTVSQYLLNKKLPIINADSLVKNIYAQSDTVDFIAKNFPQVMINHQIDFKLLREIAFESESSLAIIENHIYQKLPTEFKKAYSLLNKPNFVIYDVPLLFEKKLDSLVDYKICVYASKDLQQSRIKNRDHTTDLVIEKILRKQISIDWKKEHSDYIIENQTDLNTLYKNIEHFLTLHFE